MFTLCKYICYDDGIEESDLVQTAHKELLVSGKHEEVFASG